MKVRGLAAFLLAVLAGGCVPVTLRSDKSDAWVAERTTLDSLAAADLDRALALARARARVAEAGLEPRWRAVEARAQEQSLSRRVTLPPESRQALAESDRALLAARSSDEADSLAAAVASCRAAWNARVAWLGAGDVQTAEAALALAEAEFAVAHAGEAESLATAARDVFAERLGPSHPRVADAEDLLGRVVKNFTGRRGFDLALAHYRKALRIRVASEGPRSLSVARTLNHLGNLYRLAERSKEAEALFHAALDIQRSLLGSVDERVASTLGSMAFLHAGEGHWSDAETLARAAIAATPAGPNAPTAALAVRVGLRGQMLRRIGRAEDAVPLLSRAVALRESLWARTPRDEASSLIGGLSLHRELALALATLGRADQAFEQLERGSSRTLTGRLLGTPEEGGDPWSGLLARVQRVLAPDEAVVTWPRTPITLFVADYPFYACVVRSSGPARWVRLDRRAPLHPRIGTIRQAYWTELRAASGWPRRVVHTATAEHLARLMWREWFEPLEPALAGVHHIVVCSPDLVAGGPLGALLDDEGRWLAERFTISYTPSALLFASARERGSRAAGTRGPALIVGAPQQAVEDPARLARLEGAEEEIARIAARLPTATLLIGADARAQRLRELSATGALARFGLMHIAAHTETDPRRVLESALVLAPDVRRGGSSSRLTAREIASAWRLEADLVCLAACRSVEGVGSQTEGSLGLHWAFLRAGARAVLVTIWPVDDRATARLMDAFYARFAGPGRPAGVAEALRQAQSDVRTWQAPDGSRPFAHPAYWAGFTLVGDPG